MSKAIKHRKRLTLGSQVLRVLTSEQLAGANGGDAMGTSYSCPVACPGYPTQRELCQG